MILSPITILELMCINDASEKTSFTQPESEHEQFFRTAQTIVGFDAEQEKHCSFLIEQNSINVKSAKAKI